MLGIRVKESLGQSDGGGTEIEIREEGPLSCILCKFNKSILFLCPRVSGPG